MFDSSSAYRLGDPDAVRAPPLRNIAPWNGMTSAAWSAQTRYVRLDRPAAHPHVALQRPPTTAPGSAGPRLWQRPDQVGVERVAALVQLVHRACAVRHELQRGLEPVQIGGPHQLRGTHPQVGLDQPTELADGAQLLELKGGTIALPATAVSSSPSASRLRNASRTE